MSVVWILEKPKLNAPSAAMALLGDHAVRLFASFESFKQLIRIQSPQEPDVIVVDAEDIGHHCVSECDEFLRKKFMRVQRIFLANVTNDLTTRASGLGSVSPSIMFLRKPIDPLELSQWVARAAGEVQRQGAASTLCKFRDVSLDMARLRVTIEPSEDPQNLSPKEALLLKVFLDSPGVCLSRDEIRDKVWDDIKVAPRTIDSHISRLRRRLEGAEVTIESVYGGGYMLA